MNINPKPLRSTRNAEQRRRWRENREASERTLRRRQDRYANDPTYRERIKESVKRRRARATIGGDSRTRSFNRDRIITLDGRHITLWSSGKSAHYIGISKRTLSSWESKNIIPINRAIDSLRRRWYPSTYILFIAEMVAKRRSKERLDSWSMRVKEEWDKRQLGEQQIPIVGERSLSDVEGRDS